jgi:hypothetical protein
MPQGTVKSLNKGEKVRYEAGQGKSAMTEGDHRPGSGGTKDNVRDELGQAAGQGRRGRAARKEEAATPKKEEVQPGSGGVKDNVRDELAESQERR